MIENHPNFLVDFLYLNSSKIFKSSLKMSYLLKYININIINTSIPLSRTYTAKNIGVFSKFINNNNNNNNNHKYKYFSSFSSASFVAGTNTSGVPNVICIYILH